MEHFNPILGNDTPGQKFITCGEIMLRLTPPNYEKIRMASSFEASYGGSEANIALALANLGVDSFAVLDQMAAWNDADPGCFIPSVMSQYTPFYKAAEHGIGRRITTYEYRRVVNYAMDKGLVQGYMQQKSSAKEEYTPSFDLTGV